GMLLLSGLALAGVSWSSPALAGDGIEVVGLRQGVIGTNQQVFQAFLSCADVAELPHLIAHQFLGDRAAQGGNRTAGMLEKRGALLGGQVGDGVQVGLGGLCEQSGCGVRWTISNTQPAARSLVSRASSGKVRASRWWNWLIRRVRWRTAACSRPATCRSSRSS